MLMEKTYLILNDIQENDFLRIYDSLSYQDFKMDFLVDQDHLLIIRKESIPEIIEALQDIFWDWQKMKHETEMDELSEEHNYRMSIGDIETELE